MSGTQHVATRDTNTADTSEGRGRRFAFRLVAVVLSAWLLLISVFGLVEPVLMWWPADVLTDVVDTGTPDLLVHRSHFMAVGILAWGTLLPTLAQLRRPERRVGSMLLLLVLAVASLVVFGVTGTFGEWVVEEWTWVVPVLLLAALHPRARDLFRMPGHDSPMLALAGAAAIPWTWYALSMLGRQVTGDDVHAAEEHWGIAVMLGVLVVAASVIGAGQRDGWSLPAGIAAASSTVFGAHSVVFPGLESGLAAPWAVGAVLWGIAYAGASVARARRLSS